MKHRTVPLTCRPTRWSLLAACTLLFNGCGPQEKPYPSGPIRVVVARGAGGSTDQIARVVTPYLEKQMGVPVVVENVAGGGGVEGNNRVYQAKPDGYLLLFGATTTDIVKQVGEGTPYDYMKLTPVYNIGGRDSNLLFVHSASPIRTFADFVAAARRNGVSVSKTTGVSTSSIAMAWLVNIAGIPRDGLKPVPYEDGRSQALAVAGGHVEAGISQTGSILSLVRDGRLRVIVNFGRERSPLFPDVPSFMEIHPGEAHYYEFYQGFMAPPGLPPDVLARLTQALDAVVRDPGFQEKARIFFTLVPLGPEQYVAELAAFHATALRMKGDLAMFELK